MPDSVEHRVFMHQLARDRVKAGRPVWDMRVDLRAVRDDEMEFEDKRDAIVKILRASAWVKGYDEGDELPELVDELSGTRDEAEFGAVFDRIYDIADYDRVWIATF